MNRPWCTNRKEAVAATLAGATAGFVDISILYPFEYCKTLLQLQRGHMKGSVGGIYNCLARQLCNNGFSSLYRGYLPVACFAMPKAGVRFGSFRFFEEKVTKLTGTNSSSTAIRFYAGMMAGIAEALLVVVPQETLKTKLVELNTGFYNGVMQIIRTGRLSVFYEGVLPTIIKQSSNQAVHFSVYGLFREFMRRNLNCDTISPTQAMIGGILAGTCSVCINNPVDVVKTRMQGISKNQHTNAFQCARSILLHEGPHVFYRGILIRLGRVAPGQGIMFACYDRLVEFYS